MFGKAGIENLFHFLVPGQKLGDDAAVAIVLFHARRESLHPPQDQPALEGGKNRSRGFLHKGQFVGLLLGGANYHAAEAVAVSIEKFRGGVYDHVGSERRSAAGSMAT